MASERSPLEGYHASKSPFENAGPEKSQHSLVNSFAARIAHENETHFPGWCSKVLTVTEEIKLAFIIVVNSNLSNCL